MRRLRIFIWMVVLLLFVCTFHSAIANIIQIEGELGNTVTAYVKRWFSSYRGTKKLTYRMYFPVSSLEGINVQTVSNLRKNFIPAPTELKDFSDEFGNTGVELIWEREMRMVQLDLQFTVKTQSKFAPVMSSVPFPLPVDEEKKIYFKSTRLSPSNDFSINRIGSMLSRNLHKEIDIVSAVFLWIDRNIRLTSLVENYDAPAVLKKGVGDERGICNLLVAIFKGLGIPARLVYGISFQNEIQVSTETDTYIFDMPNVERYWVEVYFPDLGWVSYDPHGMYFGTIPHVIKLSVGPDSDFVTEVWGIEEGEAEVQKEFLYDIKNDYADFQFKGLIGQDMNKLILSPQLSGYYELPFEIEQGYQFLDAALLPGEEGPIFENSDLINSVEKDATRARVYTQKFLLDYPVIINEVQLPLLKLADEGKIWVEIYSDENGAPAQQLFRTYSINSNRIRFMMVENPWLMFPVGNKTNSFLAPGAYWFMLRSSGSCIFHWYASEGNVVGEKRDTLFREVGKKRLDWKNVINFDMNFQLIGNREEAQ